MIKRTYISKFSIWERDEDGVLQRINHRYGTVSHRSWMSCPERVFKEFYQNVVDEFPDLHIDLVFFNRVK